MDTNKVAAFKKNNFKRKSFSKGGNKKFKRFKREPKFIKDNLETQIAREKERDAYHFTDSEDDADDLGMGIDITDLPFLDDHQDDKAKASTALTQDTVRPLFSNDFDYDERKLEEGLAELHYKSFRTNQKETIKRILFGRSTLFISPTGSGKSLCYQLPALLYWRFRRYITIVVSPLISLMEDQMRNFPSCINAVTLHSGHNQIQRRRSIEQLVNGEAQVVFISPEALVGGILKLDDLKLFPPVGFVCIDEAHCLSEWSHNFRPAYLQFFKILHDQMNIKTYLGLTATATKSNSFAIARTLIINPETDVIGSTTIPDNLILSVSYESNKELALIELLKSPTFKIMTSIIVYCNRREDTEQVAVRIRTAMQGYSTLIEIPERIKTANASKNDSIRSSLNDSSEKAHMKLPWNAECYHAGLNSDVRKRIQREFIKGELRVVVATVAFGMGINKANVRAIIHYDMPSSFESYVQEIGRAGRDGKPAQCHMFLKADKTDVFYQQRNIFASITEGRNLKKLTNFLFPPCNCPKRVNESIQEKLDKLNSLHPHRIISVHKTDFTNTPLSVSDDEDDDDSGLDASPNSNKENAPVKYVRKSVVKKHRSCEGHEVAFGIEEVASELNLRPESIITLICQLEKAYPQLKIEQYNPTRSTCNIFCYHGPKQMEDLAKKSLPVRVARHNYITEYLKTHGTKCETPQKITFDIIKLSKQLSKPSADVVRMLKKTEWELVEKTGKYRRSQVRVSFEGHSFHMQAVGDLNENEIEEINNYLIDFTRLYEIVGREKISSIHETLKRYCIPLDKMRDKPIRLEASTKLKAALNAYFNPSLEQPEGLSVDIPNQHLEDNIDRSQEKEIKEKKIRADARAFLSGNGKNAEFTPRIIARIFQGISTPNFPAEVWGMNKKWWRIHLNVDFVRLAQLIQEVF